MSDILGAIRGSLSAETAFGIWFFGAFLFLFKRSFREGLMNWFTGEDLFGVQFLRTNLLWGAYFVIGSAVMQFVGAG